MIQRLTLILFAALVVGLQAAPVDIQLLCTTDLHGWMEKSERYKDGGGWLRLATVIQQERQRLGEERTLLIDCGDTTAGTLFALHTRGQVAVDMLKTLRYDVWVPGNHDFDFGVRRAIDNCLQLKDMLLCCNLEITHDGKPERFPPWRLFERGGARIAVIGATASYMEQWLWGRDVEGYKAEKVVPVLERLLPEVRAKQPDMIVLAIHQGWMFEDPRKVNEVVDIVKRFPELDLILGGHTHRDIPGMKIGARTWYVQAGYGAGYVAVVKARIDTEKHTVIDLASELRDATSKVPENTAALHAIQRPLEEYLQLSKTPVAQVAAAISASGTPGETCAVSDLYCRAFVAATGADVAFHGKLVPTASLPAGAVTAADIFAVVPFENTIGVATVSVADLKAIIEEQVLSRSSMSYNGIYGLEVRINRDGQVTALRFPDGREVPADTRLKLAMNSYAVAGGGGRFPNLRQILRAPAANLRDTGINSRQAVTEFLRQHPDLNLKPRQWLYLETRDRKPATASPASAAGTTPASPATPKD